MYLGDYHRKNRKKRHFVSNIAFGNPIDQNTLQPLTMTEIVSAARRKRNMSMTDQSEKLSLDDHDLEYEKILLQQEKNKELLFLIERYAIIMFALFFMLFNVIYWLHILWIY